MKKIILVIAIILFSTGTNAQNITMAKAFYKKAQIEYESGNYKKAIKFIESAKENLGDITNPDIIYLEAKTRFDSDLNITRAKELLTKFMNEADNNDERVAEVSKLLVEIQGIDKRYGKCYRNEYYCRFDYDSELNLIFKIGKKIRNEKYINKEVFRKMSLDKSRSEEYLNGQKVTERYTTGNEANYKLYERIYNNDNNIYIERIFPSIGKKVWDNHLTKDNATIINPQVPAEVVDIYDTGKKEIKFRYDSKQLYCFKSCENFEYKNFELFITVSNYEIIEFYPSIGVFKDELKNKIGYPKLVKENLSKGKNYFVYEFDELGIPIKKNLYSKKDKLKKSYGFDKNDSSWNEI